MRTGSRVLSLLSLLALIVLAVPEHALAQRARVQAPARLASLVQARVISDATHGRDPFTVGVEFRMAPGWHIYWKNPGDAGLAPRLRWRLPDGYTASEPYFPLPHKFVASDLVDYGYSGTTTFFVTITPPRDGRAQDRPELAVDADWLVCKEECRPGRATLRFIPGSQTAEENRQARQKLRAAQAHLPGESAQAGLRVEAATFQALPDGAEITVALSGPQAASARDFYPEAIAGWDIRYGAITVRDGTIRIPLRPSSSPRPRVIRGLVIIGASGYNLTSSIR